MTKNEAQKAVNKFYLEMDKRGMGPCSPGYDFMMWLAWRHLDENPFSKENYHEWELNRKDSIW